MHRGGDITIKTLQGKSPFALSSANSVGWWANEQGGRRHMLKLMVRKPRMEISAR
jgi:hypothetical protein